MNLRGRIIEGRGGLYTVRDTKDKALSSVQKPLPP